MIGKTNSQVGGGIKGEKVNILLLTNQSEHTDLLGATITVKYVENETLYVWEGSGIMVTVPPYVDYEISVSPVEGYTTPEKFIATAQDDNVRSVNFEYKTERVTVNVTSNDGSGAEGQLVNVTTKGDTEVIPNGVYIEDTDGYLWPTDMWNNKATPNGIAVISDECSFVMALGDADGSLVAWGGYDVTVSGIVTTTDKTTALTDYAGEANAPQIIGQLLGKTDTQGVKGAPSAEACFVFIFPNGKKGYLGAAGEWQVALDNKAAITTALSTIGYTTMSRYYWTSTQCSSIRSWSMSWHNDTLSSDVKSNSYYVRAFTALTATKLLTGDKVDSYTVKGGKAEFNMAFGTDYTVSLNDKVDYVTPQAQVFTASTASRSIAMEYIYSPGVDLSMQDIYGNKWNQTTANCYVVSKAGQYKFPLVFGNAIVDGEINAEAYTKNSGSNSHDFVAFNGKAISSPYIETMSGNVTSVQLSIADTDGVFTDLSIVDGLDCRYVHFTVANVPKTGANGVISIKKSNSIMWNWHIWVWEDDLTPVEITNATDVKYNILPVNLASKWDEDAKTHIKNWFYQFGRPTPLLCPSAYNSSSNHASYGELSYAIMDIAYSLHTGIINPTRFYKYDYLYNYNWFIDNSDKTYNLWDAGCTTTGNSDNDVKKTVYDPCPPGFKMPNGNTFSYFSKSNVVESFANGYKFKRYSGDTVGIFFPASGVRSSSNGYVSGAGSYSYVWLSSANSQNNAYNLHFESDDVDSQNASNRALACSVRPVQE